MDARAFGTFLKNTLMTEAQKYEGNLLSASYETIAEAKRCGGIRDTLVGIANSIDNVLADFYEKGGHKLPIETRLQPDESFQSGDFTSPRPNISKKKG